jgi:hypothetical protein
MLPLLTTERAPSLVLNNPRQAVQSTERRSRGLRVGNSYLGAHPPSRDRADHGYPACAPGALGSTSSPHRGGLGQEILGQFLRPLIGCSQFAHEFDNLMRVRTASAGRKPACGGRIIASRAASTGTLSGRRPPAPPCATSCLARQATDAEGNGPARRSSVGRVAQTWTRPARKCQAAAGDDAEAMAGAGHQADQGARGTHTSPSTAKARQAPHPPSTRPRCAL